MEIYEIITCCIGGALFIGVVVFWIWWDERYEARMAKRLRKRLANPDFTAVEHAVGAGLPQSLKLLYASDLVYEEYELAVEDSVFEISFFEPIDIESYAVSAGKRSEVSLANDGFGNQFLFDAKKGNGVVFRSHETGERVLIANSMEAFVELLEKCLADRQTEQVSEGSL